MRQTRRHQTGLSLLPDDLRIAVRRKIVQTGGLVLLSIAAALCLALASWKVDDDSLSQASRLPVKNWLGKPGAISADLLIQLWGLASISLVFVVALWGWRLLTSRPIDREPLRIPAWILGSLLCAVAIGYWPVNAGWPLPTGFGGVIGEGGQWLHAAFFGTPGRTMRLLCGIGLGLVAVFVLMVSCGLFFLENPAPPVSRTAVRPRPKAMDEDEEREPSVFAGVMSHLKLAAASRMRRVAEKASSSARQAAEGEAPVARRREPAFVAPPLDDAEDAPPPRTFHQPPQPVTRAPPLMADEPDPFDADDEPLPLAPVPAAAKPGPRIFQPAAPKTVPVQTRLPLPEPDGTDSYELPSLDLLAEPRPSDRHISVSMEALQENARMLEGVLDDFGVRGEIINVRPGPVVTLYELEPAPGIKSSRVIGLADDIARSMSAVSARVAVVPGRNVIGIELPNAKRENVLLREMLASQDFVTAKEKLPICLGKTIGGDPVIADLAKMPHLLVAGTTGSGKSVAINTMILSLLYRLKPEECRLIMVDPKMLELSIYDGIPHLLSPVVTDPKKAVVALKWAVREMEERYKKMSKLGVRNIDGFNARIVQAKAKGEVLHRTVQTGFDRETGEAIYEQEEMDLNPIPYIVVIVDEMADLMMVAGKDIEGAIQRLAQMARAAGIHLIMATQRPSVDVITGTIKANFPTRISFQVTSKIDSRTILGEQGAEQLLGRGDMLFMAGGGRISRVHGPFVSDDEVERIVSHLKMQGQPDYLESVTRDDDGAGEDGEAADSAVFDAGNFGEEPQDLYEKAVQVVMRDKKASTSYIQRRLQIGYNRAASLIERMEKEGLVGPANHAGKREILVGENAESDY